MFTNPSSPKTKFPHGVIGGGITGFMPGQRLECLARHQPLRGRCGEVRSLRAWCSIGCVNDQVHLRFIRGNTTTAGNLRLAPLRKRARL